MVIGCDYLSKDFQDKFLRGTEIAETVPISEPPEVDGPLIVSYRDEYYPVDMIVRDTQLPLNVFAVGAGMALMALGVIVHFLSRETLENFR